MKKIQKALLTVLILIYAGITITITLPDIPGKPSDGGTVETYQGPGTMPVGPFDDESEDH